MSELREKLADLCHSQWSGWMEYLFSKCVRVDGKAYLCLPTWAEERWKHQAATNYKDLTEKEQDSDRTEADKFLAILEKELQSAKAENGRLAEAIEYLLSEQDRIKSSLKSISEFNYHPVDSVVKRARKALSNSNALDYWQGEVRKAEVKVWSQAIEEVGKKRIIFTIKDDILNMDHDDGIRKQIRNEIVEAMESRQSNPQSKGEKAEGEG